jgi:hypothetical protein
MDEPNSGLYNNPPVRGLRDGLGLICQGCEIRKEKEREDMESSSTREDWWFEGDDI